MQLKEISQIGIVVKNIKNAMKYYWEMFSIGPWRVYTYKPPKLTETIVRGKFEPYSMRLAFTMVGPLMLELIEPLEGNSIYKEFLNERGEGIHHIASYAIEDIDKALANLEKEGIKVLQSGKYHDEKFEAFFAYLDTEDKLGYVVELVKLKGERPKPEEVYP
ncbi:MAG: VOC family protein [Nitrososphaerales archaeon]